MNTAHKIDACRSCGAKIIWTITAKGHRMPVDAERVNGGNIALAPDPSGTPTSLVLHLQKGQTTTAYRSHFVSCPPADQHRKRA